APSSTAPAGDGPPFAGRAERPVGSRRRRGMHRSVRPWVVLALGTTVLAAAPTPAGHALEPVLGAPTVVSSVVLSPHVVSVVRAQRAVVTVTAHLVDPDGVTL